MNLVTPYIFTTLFTLIFREIFEVSYKIVERVIQKTRFHFCIPISFTSNCNTRNRFVYDIHLVLLRNTIGFYARKHVLFFTGKEFFPNFEPRIQ